MTTFLTILAIHTGLFAFAFGLAGWVGLLDLDLEPPRRNRTILLRLLDHLLTGGLVWVTRDIARNWPRRRTERRFIYVALANAVACFTLILLIYGML
jgi:hypothetical protein